VWTRDQGDCNFDASIELDLTTTGIIFPTLGANGPAYFVFVAGTPDSASATGLTVLGVGGHMCTASINTAGAPATMEILYMNGQGGICSDQ
jgi:hypothetical protein